ncbi:MFS transporter [Maricaulis parjimensis]|uniref:MFS transporter n=1 Tax=Maricaulis parjimensis TaxID=144023 RepID=UPI00193AD63E|nr:MFS transporter [Maricaulis parjimensis]
MQKPALGFWQIWNISFGFFGIQMAFALQGANVSRIFQTLGADVSNLAIYWLAGPVTGLLVQPLIGHFSDRTWGPLGRRRPYFLAGAVLSTVALFFMPNSPYLWAGVVMLWVLDASVNISMEPFRAFVGDMLPSRQRTQGFAMQTIFIGAGALLASAMPAILTDVFGVATTAEPGVIPDAVKFSFYIGGVSLFLAVGWTILSSKEYSPSEMVQFREPPGVFREGAEQEVITPRSATYFLANGASLLMVALLGSFAIFRFSMAPELYVLTATAGGLGVFFLVHALAKSRDMTNNLVSHIIGDLVAMPKVMRRLAVVQFFSWFALFIMWVYATPAITSHHFGSADPTSLAYNEGANWVGWLFATYNGVSAIWAIALVVISARINRRVAHGISLTAGALGFASFFFIADPQYLLVSMVGIGMAWGSILTMPYAILSDALPSKKMGIYMGIFNFFIVLPQMVVAGVMGPILTNFLGGVPIYTFFIAAASWALAVLSLFLVPGRGQIIPAEVE